jgi:hypothetical protein
MIAELLPPGSGLLTVTPKVPADCADPQAMSRVEDTNVVVRAVLPNNTCAPLTN